MAKQLTSKTRVPSKAVDVKVVARPDLQYIPGVSESALIAGWRGLPQSIDDAEAQFGKDIYDRMLNDPVVAAVIGGLRRLVLSEGFEVRSAFPKLPRNPTAEETKLFDECAEIRDMVQDAVDNLEEDDRDFLLTLDDMLEALTHGNRLAEVTWRMQDAGKYVGKYTLEGVRTKPRQNFLYVVNEAMRLLGAMSVQAGGGSALRTGLFMQPAPTDNIVPKDRLFVLSVGARNGDPRGRSLLRPAYNPWKRRQIMDPEAVKFIAQFAGGMITATVADNSQVDVTLPDGTVTKLKSTEYVAQLLSSLGNSGVAAFPTDTTITVHYPQGSSANAFKVEFDRAAIEIHSAVIVTARAFMESSRNSQADAGQAQDTADAVVRFYRLLAGGGVRRQVFRNLVAANYGSERARYQTPVCAMQAAAFPDFKDEAPAVAQLLEKIPVAMHPQVVEDRLGLKWVDGPTPAELAQQSAQDAKDDNPGKDQDQK